MYCFFHAIARLDLSQAVLLNFSAPLYIAPIAWLWLGQAISGRLMLSALIGFAGVALILKPGTAPFSTDAAIGAFSGFLAAIAMVSLRSMAPSEPPVRAVVYFSAIGTVVSAVPLVWAWETPAPLTLLIMGAAGVFATSGQILLPQATSSRRPPGWGPTRIAPSSSRRSSAGFLARGARFPEHRGRAPRVSGRDPGRGAAEGTSDRIPGDLGHESRFLIPSP